MDWSWIDKDAEVGPILRVGPDVYERDQPGGRVLRLTTTYAPGLDYIQPAVDAFHAVADHWGAPVLFVLEPDVKKPPPVRFLFEWSQQAFANGSVEQSWFLMHSRFSRFVGKLVCRAFVSGGMPMSALNGRAELDAVLAGLDLSCPQEGFELSASSTALAVQRGFGDGMYGQLLKRFARRARGAQARES